MFKQCLHMYLFLVFNVLNAQNVDSILNNKSPIDISGQIIDTIRGDLTFHLMVINKNTGIGIMGSQEGRFRFEAGRTDTLLVSAAGYKVVKLSFADSSLSQNKFTIKVFIEPLSIELASIEIKPMKSLQELKKERQGMEREDIRELTDVVSMLEHPITALYQFFSSHEQSKRLVAEMEYEDRKRDYLKELFKLYVDFNIISLKGYEFDAFIDYLNISDAMLRNSTDIELIEYVQIRYKNFRREYDYFFVD